MNDVKEFFKPRLEEIIRMTDVAENKLKGYLRETNEKPDISFELLKILNLSDDLVELFNPSKQSGEYFGLPKDVVGGAKYPKKILDSRGINFTSWFAEKSQHIKNGIKKTIEYWEMNPKEIKLVEDAPMTVEEYIIEGLESGLYQIKAYAETILDML